MNSLESLRSSHQCLSTLRILQWLAQVASLKSFLCKFQAIARLQIWRNISESHQVWSLFLWPSHHTCNSDDYLWDLWSLLRTVWSLRVFTNCWKPLSITTHHFYWKGQKQVSDRSFVVAYSPLQKVLSSSLLLAILALLPPSHQHDMAWHDMALWVEIVKTHMRSSDYIPGCTCDWNASKHSDKFKFT